MVDTFDRKPMGLFGSAAIAFQLMMCVLVALTNRTMGQVALSQGACKVGALAAGFGYVTLAQFHAGCGRQAEYLGSAGDGRYHADLMRRWLISASRNAHLLSLSHIDLTAGLVAIVLVPTPGVAFYVHTIEYFQEPVFANSCR
ncbi:hypothetical protein [Croceibacterium xixiisoli]|uniref:hypothetical protein n=1 Tax=Croceibacterium xixiisoli TaxID=1476466 RepID=UPI00136AFAAC|nr:hypothetical protein [Croceibacterium xixiisoli]